jgi:1,4-dihydroxy-2-naphthoate octaprenyltransferase
LPAVTSNEITFGRWLQAARLKFLPQGIMPVFLAAAVAYSLDTFLAANFVIALLAAAALQVGLTMFNDTLDFVYGTDRKQTGFKNPFSGGSGVLASGTIRPRQAFVAILSLYFFALLCTIYLSLEMGIVVFWIALIGALISVFYSAKPLRFAYRGIGELMMFLGYGPIVTAWAYYVHASFITGEIILIGAVPGLLMWTMILINEIPDYEEDKAAGKKNMVYRLGPKNTKNLFIASLAAVYIYVAILLIIGVLPPLSSLAFLGVPLAVVAAVAANRHYLDPGKIVTANRFMVYIYSATTAAVAIGFLV